ncbi:MAG: poly(3-hydroxyalkanoate) depolymerase [Pseudomonadota bacterium]
MNAPIGAGGTGAIEIRDIEVRGQRLRTAVKPGPAGVPPLLMFNGIGANLELAFPLLHELKRRGAVIFDVPGVGGSPLPGRPYRAGTLARWARGVLDALDIEQADVSGVSWGGGMAQQFAFQHPRRCRRLILAATSAGMVSLPGKLSVISKLASNRRYAEPGYMRSIAAEIYGGDFRRDGALIDRHAAGMRPQSGRGYQLQLLAMLGWTSAPWLWTLRQPTLVMAGTDDPLVPVANARFLAAMIPRAELALLDNGHLFLATRPRESAEMIEAFLDRP